MLSDEEKKAIKELTEIKELAEEDLKENYEVTATLDQIDLESLVIILNLIEKQSKEIEELKEKNKRAEELYMQHNQMIIDILKECDYMIKNRYYMNDIAIRQYAEKIKDIAKYYIKEPEWIEIGEE